MGVDSAAELVGLWRALSASEGAMQYVFDQAHGGMTPDEMQERYTAELRRRGISGPVSGAAFVVGEGGAGPKLRTKQPLKPGDLWGMDFQFAVDGYYSDIGRYGVFGEPSADLLARYRRILEIQESVADAIRPGRPLGEAIAKCPPGWTIEAHRIGAEIHMPPLFSTLKPDHNTADMIVQPGIVMCVELWAAFDGGIEDEYLVTEQGLRRLTTLPRTLATPRGRDR
jgi:Xaa-Pro aminopeptidase